MTIKGIDVSGNQGVIDFKKVKADGVDFVLIKAGYANSTVGTFERNYANAKAAGLHTGAYWYSYAGSADDARSEAAACIAALKGKRFDYPVYFDLEERSQLSRGRAFCSELVDTFCGELKKAGYLAGLYMSRSPLQELITSEVAEGYELWIAEWSSKCRYNGDFGIWQYSDNGRVDGISGAVDLDYCYKDYPAAVASGGYNGYAQDTAVAAPTASTAERKIGGIVRFKGGSVYVSSTAKNTSSTRGESRCRITAMNSGGKHPFHLVSEDGKGVYGWVDASDVEGGNSTAAKPQISVDELAREVVRGDWGNGDERKRRLAEAGYDYSAVQARVEELMR